MQGIGQLQSNRTEKRREHRLTDRPRRHQNEDLSEISQLVHANLVILGRRMSLDPSINQTGFGPASTPQALLVVAPDGRVQFATAQARLWLIDFVPEAPAPDRLPEVLTRWLSNGISGGQPSRFIVELPETRLCLQVLFREATSICLLLERSPRLNASPRCSALTQRQIEVLAWVARGKTNAEIGEILSLKTGTIGKYLERIFPKLGVENRTAAASFVLRPNAAS
jgi:DNA-binding CsgD family transcriptional regulator